MGTIFAIFYALFLHAQDESFIKRLISQTQTNGDDAKPRETLILESRSANYFYDINGDEKKEKIFIERKDMSFFIKVHSSDDLELFKAEVSSLGKGARPYKISFHKISSKTALVMIYHYEGHVEYLDLASSARLYFIAMDMELKGPFKLQKGPVIWEERSGRPEHYHQRRYDVRVKDVNGDNQRDIIVSHGTIERIYSYQGEGVWSGAD